MPTVKGGTKKRLPYSGCQRQAKKLFHKALEAGAPSAFTVMLSPPDTATHTQLCFLLLSHQSCREPEAQFAWPGAKWRCWASGSKPRKTAFLFLWGSFSTSQGVFVCYWVIPQHWGPHWGECAPLMSWRLWPVPSHWCPSSGPRRAKAWGERPSTHPEGEGCSWEDAPWPLWMSPEDVTQM